MLRSLIRSFALILIIFTALPAEAPASPRRKNRAGRSAVSFPRQPEPRSLEEAFAQAMKVMAETKDRGASDFIKEMKLD